MRELDEACKKRKEGQDDQWHCHQRSCVVTDMGFLRSKKSNEYHPESVDRSEKCSRHGGDQEPCVSFFTGKRVPQDGILTVKTGCYERDRGERSRADQEGPVDYRDFLPQAAHSEDIVFMVKQVNY